MFIDESLIALEILKAENNMQMLKIMIAPVKDNLGFFSSKIVPPYKHLIQKISFKLDIKFNKKTLKPFEKTNLSVKEEFKAIFGKIALLK